MHLALNLRNWPAPVLMVAAAGFAAAQDKPLKSGSPAVAAIRAYEHAEQWDDALKQTKTALVADPKNPELATLLAEIARHQRDLMLQRQWIAIAKADKAWNDGEYATAQDATFKLVDGLTDAAALSKVKEILAREPPLWNSSVFMRSIREGLPYKSGVMVAVILATFLLIALARVFYRPAQWRLGAIQEPDGSRIGDLVIARMLRLASQRPDRVPLSFGLLSLQKGAVSLRSLGLVLEQPVTLDSAFKSVDFKVGEVDVGKLAAVAGALRGWFFAKTPVVSGSVTVGKDAAAEVTVFLTAVDPRGAILRMKKRSLAVSESGSGAAQQAADSAAFQMYYLLANPDASESTPVAESCIQKGLRLLEDYGALNDSNALVAALHQFVAARQSPDAPRTATLFEGIALDLLEQHDDAVARFRQVARDVPSGSLHEIALYNEATAFLRQYRPESLVKAENLFSALAAAPLDAGTAPVRALALAGKATAVAHYPIFWQPILHKAKAQDDDELTKWKGADWEKVRGWEKEVEEISRVLLQYADSPERLQAGWDVTEIDQLNWAAENALGNVYLNIAANFLIAPLPPELQSNVDRVRVLQTALQYFQASLKHGYPGVETLSNLGTTLFYLKRYPEARGYLEQAVTLNPKYEYAFYRLAQTWEAETNQEQVIATIRSFKGSIRISHFRDLYQAYLPLLES